MNDETVHQLCKQAVSQVISAKILFRDSNYITYSVWLLLLYIVFAFITISQISNFCDLF